MLLLLPTGAPPRRHAGRRRWLFLRDRWSGCTALVPIRRTHTTTSTVRRVSPGPAIRELGGIFHGRSAKHSIIFVEPQETIEVNNDITMLLDEEHREIIRILKELTAYLAQHREELMDFARIMRTVDFIHAKARFAYEEKAVMPNLSKKPESIEHSRYAQSNLAGVNWIVKN